MSATSNRDRIGRAIEILSGALEPWIAVAVAPKLPAASTWTDLLAWKDGRPDRTYEPSDPQCQLRIITERIGNLGFLFSGILSRGEQNLAGELREVRNKWAHNSPFSMDDTYRALDTAERLLRAINAPAEADYVGFDLPDEFVVGYGLDYAEKYRNLPFVGTLQPHVYNN